VPSALVVEVVEPMLATPGEAELPSQAAARKAKETSARQRSPARHKCGSRPWWGASLPFI
jgi:hypothetical protein